MKRILTIGFGLALAISLFGCASKAPTSTPDNQNNPSVTEEPAEKSILPDLSSHTIKLNVPSEYEDKVTVTEGGGASDTNHKKRLLSVAETESVKAAQAMHPGEDLDDGVVFNIFELDLIGYETFLSTPRGYDTVFATNKDGSKYYLLDVASGVNLTRENGVSYSDDDKVMWDSLITWARHLPEKLIEENSNLVEFFDDSFLTNNGFVFEGRHVAYRYAELDELEKDKRNSVYIVVGQPTGEGEGKIWAVDWVSYFESPRVEVCMLRDYPSARGIDKTSEEYYAELQARADAGEQLEILTPEGALNEFINSSAWLIQDTDISKFEVTKIKGAEPQS